MTKMSHLEIENEELRQRLEEADAALDAIRNGHVDALVVASDGGHSPRVLRPVCSAWTERQPALASSNPLPQIGGRTSC